MCNANAFLNPLPTAALAVFAFMMTYVHCKSQRQGSYSFGNPAALDIAGAVSTNTLKRGQVTRTSFRPMGSSGTSQNTPETVAILSQPRDSTRASSTISGSESFEWNHTWQPQRCPTRRSHKVTSFYYEFIITLHISFLCLSKIFWLYRYLFFG